MHHLKGKLCIALRALTLLRFLLCLGFVSGGFVFGVGFFFNPVWLSRFYSFVSSGLLLDGLFRCLLSGTPKCHLLTSKPFKEIILKFCISWESFNSDPINSKCLFYSNHRQSLTFPLCFFLTPVMELPGFYTVIKGYPFSLNCMLPSARLCAELSFQCGVLSSSPVWRGFCLAMID